MSSVERAEVLEKLKSIFNYATNGRVSLTEITEEMKLTEDVGFYSLDLLDVRFELESEYDFQIPDEEIVRLNPVKSV